MYSVRVRTLAALLIAASVAAGARADEAQAPRLQVPLVDGGRFDLDAQRGHVVVLHYWATWCVPCLQEMPALEDFYTRYRDRGVLVLALSEDRTRDLVDVHRAMHGMKMSYPVAMAHQATLNSLGDPRSLPQTLVLDAQGAVRARIAPDTEPLTLQALEKAVLPLLAAAPHS